MVDALGMTFTSLTTDPLLATPALPTLMKTILVIEDEPIIRSIIAEMLEEENFQVIAVEDGQAGIEAVEVHQPDLILCDIMMPKVDGYSVLSTIRQNIMTAAIPFIFLTAKTDRPDIRRGMLLGADDYLTKPFTIRELVETVKMRLERQATLTQVYIQQANEQSLEWGNRAAELRRAIDRGEFLLHYQPQVSLATGQIVGAEALVRWQSPERGLVPPSEFIPLAEATGLIIPLGEWVLQTACLQVRKWQLADFPPLQIAVNLSSVQFNQADLIDRVQQTLRHAHLEPQFLSLELTESLLVQNVEATITKLTQLKELKIQIAIDDFGTGYASLGYLQHFPFDLLKIDRCFVSGIDRNPKNAAITTALIQMAHELQLKIIAEGVEQEAEKAFLAHQGCDRMQGYLFSRPLPILEFEQLLQQNHSCTSADRTEE